MEHNAHSIPLKHTGDPAHGPCCWVRFTSQGFPWGPHQQISFSVCHPLWETRHWEEFGCLQPMSPQRRGCPGTPCNVACISRACLLTSSSAEGGENELSLELKLLACPASGELSEQGHAGTLGECHCKRGRDVWQPWAAARGGRGANPWDGFGRCLRELEKSWCITDSVLQLFAAPKP